MKNGLTLSLLLRYLFCLIFPPLAVLDQSCGTFLLVLFFTICGWLPGTILALLIVIKQSQDHRTASDASHI